MKNNRREFDRRTFLTGLAATTAASCCVSSLSKAIEPQNVGPNDKLVGAVMGLNGRGSALANGFLKLGDVHLKYLCDVDSRALDRCGQLVDNEQGVAASKVKDFRKILDDKDVDFLVVATPNHWHAPATIEACLAGKHVYVEKPCGHTAEEGEWSVDIARRKQAVVQMGTQRRSWPAVREAIQKIHDGLIGDVHYARTWYNNRRTAVPSNASAAVPDWLDWDLWQGPAPRRDYFDGLVHYNWHWFWHWGNGELGNNGVHGLDVARWGMNVTFPTNVSAGGGKYRHDDSQETADTMMVVFDFPNQKTITWEGLSWSALGPHDTGFGISFHGTEGSVVIHDPGYSVLDMKNKVMHTEAGSGGDAVHLKDFADAVRSGTRPHADIEDAHQSTLLCHLGNIAYRNRSSLEIDPDNGHIKNDSIFASFWGREYETGWQPIVKG